MHRFAAKAGLLLAVAAMTVTGVAYAANATGQSHSARPPLRNIAYVYNVDTNGGEGVAVFDIAPPPPGVYQASFTANFSSTPEPRQAFSCLLVKDGAKNLAQSTSTGRTTSAWYVGVDGLTTVRVTVDTKLTAQCGLTEHTAWEWGDRPLQVTLTRLDGATYQPLTSVKGTLHPSIGAAAR